MRDCEGVQRKLKSLETKPGKLSQSAAQEHANERKRHEKPYVPGWFGKTFEPISRLVLV